MEKHVATVKQGWNLKRKVGQTGGWTDLRTSFARPFLYDFRYQYVAAIKIIHQKRIVRQNTQKKFVALTP